MASGAGLSMHFALTQHGHHYLGQAPEFWAFRGRMFGGYTAAAALLAATRCAPPDAMALTATFSYLSAAEVGPYRVAATDVRTGRSSTAVNVRLDQGGQTRLTLSSWFVRPDLLPPAHDAARDIPAAQPPDQCAGTWRDDKNPFDAAYQRRALDYPAARRDYPSHGPDIDLWIRLIDPWSFASTVQRQAADLMVLDAHMAEVLVDGLRADPTRSYSIDLAVRWSDAAVIGGAGEAAPGWRRLRVHGEARGRIGLTSAQLLCDNRVAAEATQHVAVGPPREGGN
jgi:hypothetical protein